MTKTAEDKRTKVLEKLLGEGLQPGSLTLDEARFLLDSSNWIIEHIEAWPEDLHPLLAQMVVDQGNQWIFQRIGKFKGADQKRLAIQLLRSGKRQFLTVSSGDGGGPFLEPFEWLDQDVAIAMIEAGEGLPVKNFPHAFKNLDPKEVVWAMAKKWPDHIEGFMKNFGRKPVPVGE